MGCARDIVEFVGVPRFLFSDFPLGNAAGRPGDRLSQRRSLSLALELLTVAGKPRTTWCSPQRWSAGEAWKSDYCNVDKIDAAEIARRSAEFRQQKEIAKTRRREG